jgi:hypothetical protein
LRAIVIAPNPPVVEGYPERLLARQILRPKRRSVHGGNHMKKLLALATLVLLVVPSVVAAPITDPDDPRSFQGATVGTFAELYYGSNTLANRQLVVDNQLLDDGLFSTAGFIPGTLITSVGDFSAQGAARRSI